MANQDGCEVEDGKNISKCQETEANLLESFYKAEGNVNLAEVTNSNWLKP